jgi:Glycosyltransferase family 87
VKPETRVPAKLILSLALLAAAWASAGPAPVRDAVMGASRPVDFARDYVTAHARVHLGRGAPPVGEVGNDYAAAIGAPRVVILGGPYFIHPPPALLPILPLVPLGFEGAALAWLVLSLAALAVLAFFLVEASGRDDQRPALRAGLLGLVLLAWPPVLHNLSKGQWSLLLAALLAGGWAALERGRARAAGLCLGLAASLKATPLLLLGYLALRHRRAALAMTTTVAVAGALSVAANGLLPWRAWFTDAPADVAAWQTWTANTVSLGGAVGRLFAGGPYAHPLVAAPSFAHAVTIALSLALVGVAALVTLRAPATPETERALFAAWASLVVVLNPLAWTHTAVLALLPLALLARASASLLPIAALVVLTIPRETLAALAGPPPVRPFAGLVLSLHAAAVLALFVHACTLARARQRT